MKVKKWIYLFTIYAENLTLNIIPDLPPVIRFLSSTEPETFASHAFSLSRDLLQNY